MDEGDEPTVGAAAGFRIDKLEALGLESSHRRANVVRDEREMMKPLPPPFNKARNHSVRSERLEELDPQGASGQEGDAHAFGWHVLDRFRLEPQGSVAVNRLIDAPNGDADVVRGSDQTSCLGLYVPKDVRKTSLISPKVAPATTAARIDGIMFNSPLVTASRRRRARSVAFESLALRNAFTRRTCSASCFGSVPWMGIVPLRSANAFRPTTVRSPCSSSSW